MLKKERKMTVLEEKKYKPGAKNWLIYEKSREIARKKGCWMGSIKSKNNYDSSPSFKTPQEEILWRYHKHH